MAIAILVALLLLLGLLLGHAGSAHASWRSNGPVASVPLTWRTS